MKTNSSSLTSRRETSNFHASNNQSVSFYSPVMCFNEKLDEDEEEIERAAASPSYRRINKVLMLLLEECVKQNSQP